MFSVESASVKEPVRAGRGVGSDARFGDVAGLGRIAGGRMQRNGKDCGADGEDERNQFWRIHWRHLFFMKGCTKEDACVMLGVRKRKSQRAHDCGSKSTD